MSEDKIAEIRTSHDAVYDDRLETVWRVGLAMRNSVREIKLLQAEVERLRAENARLRAQIDEYFREPGTHPVEEA